MTDLPKIIPYLHVTQKSGLIAFIIFEVIILIICVLLLP